MNRIQPRLRRRSPETAPEEPSLCIKYTLFFVNVIFWLAGGIILALGIYIVLEMKESYQKLADLKFQPAILFVLLGGLIFIITFLGCIGALRENTCILCTYVGAVVLILILLISCAALGFFYRNSLEQKVTSKLKDAIVLYRDPKKQDLQLIIDTVQTELNCCGVQGYNDWNSNIYFNCSSPGSESCGVPFSCCKAKLQANRQCGYGARLLGRTDRSDVIFTDGCVKKGVAWISDNLLMIGGISVGLLGLQIVSACLAAMFRGQVQDVKDFAARE